MKRYAFNITIYEGEDEWWENIKSDTGCDEVKELLEDHLFNIGINADIILTNFIRGD